MRATKLLVASEIAIFAIFFLVAFLNLNERADIAGRAALGGFEFCGAAVSLYLLSKGRLDKTSLLDWLCSASAVLIACFGFTGCSITLFAFYLLIRDRHDLNTRAAATVAAAVRPAPTGVAWLFRRSLDCLAKSLGLTSSTRRPLSAEWPH